MDEIIARLEKFNADFSRAYSNNAPRTEAELKELGAIIGLLRAELKELGAIVGSGKGA